MLDFEEFSLQTKYDWITHYESGNGEKVDEIIIENFLKTEYAIYSDNYNSLFERLKRFIRNIFGL